MKNRVLIVATTSYAGMGPYVTNIYNAFSPEDEVFFLGRDYNDEYFPKNLRNELHPMCKFYHKGNTHWNTLIDLFFTDHKFEKMVIEYCEEKEINIVHYITRPLPQSILKKLHKKGIKTLGTVHDLHVHETSAKLYKQFRQFFNAKYLKRDIEAADNIITNSPIQYEEIKELYADKKVEYQSFPSLVTEKIASGKDIPTEMKSIDKPYILFFGLIEEYKGIDLLVEAYRSSEELVNNFNLVIAGRGIIKSDWRKPGVIFINRFIKDEEVAELYKTARCVVYPYISATQSGVLSIAFYFGTPTLTSDVPFFKSIVEPNKAGITFRRSDIKDIIDKLLYITRIDCTDMVLKEKCYYNNNYNINSYKQILLSIYYNL